MKLNAFALVLALGFTQLEAKAEVFASGNFQTLTEKSYVEKDPAEIIARYIQAVGGKAKVDLIKNSTMTMEADFQGTNIIIQGISDQVNKRVYQETNVMGNVVQKTVIANGKGKMIAMGQEQELNEEMMQMMQSQAYVFPEMHYEELGYSLEHRGTEEIDGEEANTLVITAPNGMETMEYYSTKSGLKLKTSSSATGDIGYSDYEVVDGVMFPMTMTIKNPMLPSAMVGKVTSIKFNQELNDEDFK